LGQRSRKRGRRSKPPRAFPASASGGAPVMSRSERRDAAIRATLSPLAPGERPWSIRAAALLAAATGGVQLVLFLAGVRLRVAGTHPAAGSTIVFAVLMFVCAIGVWLLRYWAVLGFMALLAIAVVNFSLALVRVSSLLGLAIALAGIGLPGFLFFKLVRVLSRIQMPKFPGS
jgi:hypothetical protein